MMEASPEIHGYQEIRVEDLSTSDSEWTYRHLLNGLHKRLNEDLAKGVGTYLKAATNMAFGFYLGFFSSLLTRERPLHECAMIGGIFAAVVGVFLFTCRDYARCSVHEVEDFGEFRRLCYDTSRTTDKTFENEAGKTALVILHKFRGAHQSEITQFFTHIDNSQIP